jgi:hypothetical protein
MALYTNVHYSNSVRNHASQTLERIEYFQAIQIWSLTVVWRFGSPQPCPTTALLTPATHWHPLHVGGHCLKSRFLTQPPSPKETNPSIGYASLLSIPWRQYLTELNLRREAFIAWRWRDLPSSMSFREFILFIVYLTMLSVFHNI